MIANAARLVLVGGGLLAVLGSATSNPPPQPSYYTQKPPQQQPGYQQQQQGYAPPHQQPAQGQYTPCQYACGQVSRCSIQPYDACIAECQRLGSESSPSGRQQLDTIARMNCQQLAQLNQQGYGQPQPPAQPGQRQWQCNASGGWQRCDPQTGQCTPQSASASGSGQSELLARGAAETNCGNTMNGMMGASFTFRNNVTSSCRATSCTPR